LLQHGQARVPHSPGRACDRMTWRAAFIGSFDAGAAGSGSEAVPRPRLRRIPVSASSPSGVVGSKGLPNATVFAFIDG
jgi:hypothetical protein